MTKFFRPQTTEPEPAPVIESPKDLAALVGPDIASQAMEARRVIQKRLDGYAAVNPKWREEAVRVTHRRIATDYLTAIEAIRGAASREDLGQLQRTLQQRLDAGYAMPANATRDALWIRLLREFEIVTDCLSDNALWRFQDRLNDLARNLG